MKILILANSAGGLYNFRKELLQALLMNGCYVYAAIPPHELVQQIEELSCEVIETPISRHSTNPLQDLKLLGLYRRVLKEVQPDVVLTYTIKPNIYGGMACAQAGIPYVVNITGLGTAVENPGILQRITLMLYRVALRKVQTVFFQNAENEAFFARHKLAIGKHKLIPGSGVNLEYFQAQEYPDSKTVDFVFVGRLMKAKGIDQYLEAAKVIRERHPETRFHICGSCEEAYQELMEELEQSGVVIYHGSVKDMREMYKQIHCTIHPTYYPEGLSNVLLESAASARPIITTDRSGCREVVDHGINGFVVKQRDSADLIEKIEKFLALSVEQRREMGLAGRKKVEREFDRQIVVEAYLRELEAVGRQ